MPWTVEIHHIDIRIAGDATLIVARNSTTNAVHSVLIDGGRKESASVVHGYIRNTANLTRVDAMVATHYDGDHLGGLVALLNKGTTTYNSVRVYDRGWPGGGPEALYQGYLSAINRKSGRSRVTLAVRASDSLPGVLSSMVNSSGTPAIPAATSEFNLITQGITQPANWLLLDTNRREILKAGGNGAPTLTCIACNQWVLRPGNLGPVRAAGGVSEDENASSIALLLEFGNFKYYVGGDIEDTQEVRIAEYVNQANNANGRVMIMKASHHGSDTATSDSFIRRMRPIAVMISNGLGNKHGHPAQGTVNVLNGYPRNGGVVPLPVPPGPSARPVITYFTGFDRTDNLDETYVSLGRVAGDPVNDKRGHICVTVTEAQATGNPIYPGSVYWAVTAAVKAAAMAVTAGNYDAVAAAAAEAAVTGTMVDAAFAISNTDNTKTVAAALWTLYCANSNGTTSDFIAGLSLIIDKYNDDQTRIDNIIENLMGTDTLTGIVGLATSVAQVSTSANGRFPNDLSHAGQVVGRMQDLATVFRLFGQNDAANGVDGQVTTAQGVVANSPAGVAALAQQAANAAVGISRLTDEEDARTQTEALALTAKSTCATAAKAISDLRLAYIAAANLATEPTTSDVAKVVTLAAGNSAEGVAAGVAAGVVFGGGVLQFTCEAIRGALSAVGINPAQTVQAVTQTLNANGIQFDDRNLFSVKYYSSDMSDDIIDQLA